MRAQLIMFFMALSLIHHTAHGRTPGQVIFENDGIVVRESYPDACRQVGKKKLLLDFELKIDRATTISEDLLEKTLPDSTLKTITKTACPDAEETVGSIFIENIYLTEGGAEVTRQDAEGKGDSSDVTGRGKTYGLVIYSVAAGTEPWKMKIIRRWPESFSYHYPTDVVLSNAGSIATLQELIKRGGKPIFNYPVEGKNIEFHQKNRLIEEAIASVASGLGYVTFTDEQWLKMSKASPNSYLRAVFDGRVQLFKGLYWTTFNQFLNNYAAYCRGNLSSGYIEVPIVSTSKLVDGYGVQVGPKKTSVEKVRVKSQFAKAYGESFNELQEWVPLLVPSVTNPPQRRQLVQEEIDSSKAFFENTKCSDPAMTQLEMNMLRVIQGKPSIQAADDKVPGLSVDRSREPLLVYIDVRGDAIVEYGYINTPRAWLPEKPAKLLQKTRQAYGEELAHHLRRGTTPTGLAVIVKSIVPKGSLEEMWVHRLGAGDSSLNRNIWRDMRKKGITFKSNRELFFVECTYAASGSIAYWYKEQPAEFTADKLKSIHPDHPLLNILPPKDSCPKEFKASEAF